jgi:deazaflavin-dependent oxidoreductase (nitroreductase family)
MASRLGRPVYLAIGEILTSRPFTRWHRWVYRWTGGRGVLSRGLGTDMLLVTARGRRTGEPRTVPLGAIRDGDAWVVVGSNAGKDREPAWAHNLRADGDVQVAHRDVHRPYHAHEADADEAARLWPKVIDAYPGYGVYRERTDRPIALFVLVPVDLAVD